MARGAYKRPDYPCHVERRELILALLNRAENGVPRREVNSRLRSAVSELQATQRTVACTLI